MPYRTTDNPKDNLMNNTALLKLLVPHAQFGSEVTANTWERVEEAGGVMSVLSFSGAMQFFWYALCGWSLVEYGINGVLFAKEIAVDSE